MRAGTGPKHPTCEMRSLAAMSCVISPPVGDVVEPGPAHVCGVYRPDSTVTRAGSDGCGGRLGGQQICLARGLLREAESNRWVSGDARPLASEMSPVRTQRSRTAYPGVTGVQWYPSEETEIVRSPVLAMMTPPEVSIPPDQKGPSKLGAFARGSGTVLPGA